MVFIATIAFVAEVRNGEVLVDQLGPLIFVLDLTTALSNDPVRRNE